MLAIVLKSPGSSSGDAEVRTVFNAVGVEEFLATNGTGIVLRGVYYLSFIPKSITGTYLIFEPFRYAVGIQD